MTGSDSGPIYRGISVIIPTHTLLFIVQHGKFSQFPGDISPFLLVTPSTLFYMNGLAILVDQFFPSEELATVDESPKVKTNMNETDLRELISFSVDKVKRLGSADIDSNQSDKAV